MISVDSLTKVYGHRVAAWRVSFEVAAGEVLGFLGPNVNRYHVAELVYASGAKRLAARRKDDTTWTASSGTPIPSAEIYALLVAVIEAPTLSWSEGVVRHSATATLEYVTDTRGRGPARARALEGSQNRSVATPSVPRRSALKSSSS